MRPRVLARLLVVAGASALAAPGCAARTQPYRFAMPMLGQADVPRASLPGTRDIDASEPTGPTRVAAHRPDANHPSAPPSRPRPHYAYGWQTDAQAGIRTATARGIELSVPEASDQAALAITQGAEARSPAREVVWSKLPAPNKPAPTGVTAAIDLPPMRKVREPAGLRALVGTRDKRAPFAIVTGWVSDLGLSFVERGTAIDMARAALDAPSDGPALVVWAQAHGKLYAPTETPAPGDLLVFDRAVENEPADLVALVIARDERGVTEIMYAGGGVIRRGFVDAAHPTTRRDLGGKVMNTFLRHGKQWPPKGTRYLAGELLAHIVRLR